MLGNGHLQRSVPIEFMLLGFLWRQVLGEKSCIASQFPSPVPVDGDRKMTTWILFDRVSGPTGVWEHQDNVRSLFL